MLDDHVINLNLIEEVGDFLVVEGEDPSRAFIEERIGLDDPEYVTAPFSDLA
ncbi:MAG: hypothetical protein ABEK12_03440 [Candidatus Nanohaloarchaea archaeon]